MTTHTTEFCRPPDGYCRAWVDAVSELAVSNACGNRDSLTFTLANLRKTADECDALPSDKNSAFGALLQLACEQPERFHAMFSPLLEGWFAPRKGVHPPPFHLLSNTGLSFVSSLFSNGIMDDWCIYLQWRPEGYVVVDEDDRTNAGQGFDFDVAGDFLRRYVGG